MIATIVLLIRPQSKDKQIIQPRKIYKGAVKLFLFRHCPSSESILTETKLFNINMMDTYFKS